MEMYDVQQCPKCRGSGYSTVSVPINEKIPVTSFSQRLPALIGGAVFLGIAVVIGFSGASKICSIPLAFVGLICVLVGFTMNDLGEQVVYRRHYECHLCGYHWE